MIELSKIQKGDSIYQAFRNRHYVPNNDCIGRQIHYLIFNNNIPIGIISGASTAWSVKSRDAFFGDKFNRNLIINNNVFRLEDHQKNFATQIVKMWRYQIAKDWNDVYGDVIIGYDTFVEPPRTGALYKADNWTCTGETSGISKRHHGGLDSAHIVMVETSKKLMFVKWAKKETHALVKKHARPDLKHWSTQIPYYLMGKEEPLFGEPEEPVKVKAPILGGKFKGHGNE